MFFLRIIQHKIGFIDSMFSITIGYKIVKDIFKYFLEKLVIFEIRFLINKAGQSVQCFTVNLLPIH